jgi:hypothetical protein
MVRFRYTYDKNTITLEQLDFGLYAICLNGAVVKECHCKQKAMIYIQRTINIIQRSSYVSVIRRAN